MDLLFGKNKNKGMLTLELLFAFSILLINTISIMLLMHQGSNIYINSEINNEAIYLAHKNIENEEINAINNFNNIHSYILESEESVFREETKVFDISPCVKDIKKEIIWQNFLKEFKINLKTKIVSKNELIKLGNFCESYNITIPWNNLNFNENNLGNIIKGNATSIYGMYINNTRYIFLITDSETENDFYIINANDLEINENDINSLKIKTGLKDLSIAKINNNYYAFILTNDKEHQLQVVNVTNPISPILIEEGERTIPNVTGGEEAYARTIFFYDNKIYIGTNYLAFGNNPSNHELHIYNVSNGENPIWEDSININRNINDIIVRDNYAFLATGPGGNNTPIKIYNLENKLLLSEIITPINRAGTSLYVLGNNVYLGLERKTTGEDFYILKIENNSLSILKSISLNQKNTYISDIIVQGNYAFISLYNSNNQNTFQIFNIEDKHNPIKINTCTNTFPKNSTAIFYMDNLLFSSFFDSVPFGIINNNTEEQC